MRIRFLYLVLLCGFCLTGQAKVIIPASDWGIVPGSECDALPALRRMFGEIEKMNVPVEVRFQPGEYHIYAPAAKDKSILKSEGIVLTGVESLTIDGCGAMFIGHGAISPFFFYKCKDIQVKNIDFDWNRTLISQGTLVGWNDDYVDIEIDKNRYPYKTVGDKVVFYGDDWESDVSQRSYSTLYDDKGDILQGTKDYFLSRENVLFRGKSEEIKEGCIRFYGKPDTYVRPGVRIALYHGLYCGTIFSLNECIDVRLQNIDIYHTPGMGAVGQRSENIYLEDFNLVVDKDNHRCFSGIADALHFNMCRGKITLKGCSFDGQGDDALNVHGRYHRLSYISGNRKSAVFELRRGSLADMPIRGDQLWFIDNDVDKKPFVAKVTAVTIMNAKTALVEFEEPLDECIQAGCHVDNASWIADVEISGCSFGKANRARGILLTTCGDLKVHHNKFRSAGAAILIEGDTDFWFESGPVKSLDIAHNTFENCATSVRDSITHWGWGEAVITVTPSHRPADALSKAYHSGITIRNNVFKAFDLPLVYARSVDGLKYVDNIIVHTENYKPVLWHRNALTLDGCRNVIIKDNECDPIFRLDDPHCEHMNSLK